jgi:hypothetical protein
MSWPTSLADIRVAATEAGERRGKSQLFDHVVGTAVALQCAATFSSASTASSSKSERGYERHLELDLRE